MTAAMTQTVDTTQAQAAPEAASQPKMINGVDVSKLFGTLEAVKETPCLAAFRFRNKNRWIEGGHNRSTIKGFYGVMEEDTTRTEPFVLDADEPPVLLGTDTGPNPVEYLLAALAGCMTTSIVYHAAAKGIEIEELESRFEGDLDLQGFLGLSKEVRPGYQQIRVTFRIKADAPEEVLDELIAAGPKYSPVFDVVSRGTQVVVDRER